MNKAKSGLFVAIVAMMTTGSFFVSCGDDELEIEYYDTYIDGYITDYHTGEPITDVSFEIYCSQSNDVGGMGYVVASSGSYHIQNVAHTNSQGYYRIQIPKTINGDVMKLTTLIPHNNNPNYCFNEEKRINYDWYDVKHQSYRIDVRAITYGYLKVIAPLEISFGLGYYFNTTYEIPLITEQCLYNNEIGENKEALYIVPATNGVLYYGIYGVYPKILCILLLHTLEIHW